MLPLTSTKRLPRRLFIPVAAVQSVSQFARHFRAHGLLKVRRKDDCEVLTYLMEERVVQLKLSASSLDINSDFGCKEAVESSVREH